MKLYNSLTRQKEEFIPLIKDEVTFYHCGPTVYWTQHIGNLRGMTIGDWLRRCLQYLGYKVTHVRNYTDVGHLTSDSDDGEDKMAKGAKREGLTPEAIANKYIKQFEADTQALNLLEPTYKPRATTFIKPMIKMIKELFDKGFAYQTELAIYFDISRFSYYNELSHQSAAKQQSGAGKSKIDDPQKRQSQDFALWFFKKGQHLKAMQIWESPWGEGFPGWHIECSVMSRELLGKTIDIHMGGVEHIPIHHTNEIAQSEAANGQKFVNYWLHNEHLLVNNAKMAKSAGTGFSLQEIVDHGFDPLDLRYLFLQAHYRSQQNFTWEALRASREARQKLVSALYNCYLLSGRSEKGKIITQFQNQFLSAISDDLNLSQALAVLWAMINSSSLPADILASVLKFDLVLGLRLKESLRISIPLEIQKMAEKRIKERQQGNFQLADNLRKQIEKKGFLIEDRDSGFIIKPRVF